MKRFFAFTLAMLMVLSGFMLAGCNKNKDNLYKDLDEFESYVSEKSEIIGDWQETSTTDDLVCKFFKTTSLHLTKTTDGVSMSTVCTFNYNDDTGVLSYYVFSNGETFTYNVTIEGEDMTWTSEDGSETRTFEKITG